MLFPDSLANGAGVPYGGGEEEPVPKVDQLMSSQPALVSAQALVEETDAGGEGAHCLVHWPFDASGVIDMSSTLNPPPPPPPQLLRKRKAMAHLLPRMAHHLRPQTPPQMVCRWRMGARPSNPFLARRLKTIGPHWPPHTPPRPPPALGWRWSTVARAYPVTSTSTSFCETRIASGTSTMTMVGRYLVGTVVSLISPRVHLSPTDAWGVW